MVCWVYKCRMFTSQTRMHVTEMTLANMSSRSSSLHFRGIFSLIWDVID